jgi:hypothetical protein
MSKKPAKNSHAEFWVKNFWNFIRFSFLLITSESLLGNLYTLLQVQNFIAFPNTFKVAINPKHSIFCWPHVSSWFVEANQTTAAIEIKSKQREHLLAATFPPRWSFAHLFSLPPLVTNCNKNVVREFY